jgi:hypothetical protein
MFAQRFHQILPGGRTNSVSRVNLRNARRDAIKSRIDLLNAIYRPAFASLKKGSPEYDDLANSGRVWETFFKPGNIEPYLQAQSDLKQTLASIDEIKEWYQENDKAKITILRALVPEYAHQSTSLEQNPLHAGDAVVISDDISRNNCSAISILCMICQLPKSQNLLYPPQKNFYQERT